MSTAITLTFGILLLEIARHAGDRAAGADAGDEPVDAALHLAPDLGAGRAVVRLVVRPVVVLVGEEGAGDLGGEAARHPVVALRMLGRQIAVDQHELDAHRAQGVDLLGAGLLAHHHHAAQVVLDRHHRQAHRGVARRRLDDRAAGTRAGRRPSPARPCGGRCGLSRSPSDSCTRAWRRPHPRSRAPPGANAPSACRRRHRKPSRRLFGRSSRARIAIRVARAP